MAELPNIGKHCSVGSCKLLDFLPFACDGCKKIFCSEHRVKDVHCCSSEYISKATGEFSGVKGYDCSLLGCKKRELTPIMCEKCRLSFCLSHRHEVDHNCSKLEKTDTTTSVSRTAEHVKTILESKTGESSKRRQGVKNAKMAAKVSLMKMKMKSLGDPGCPEAERVYFQVYPPLECQKPEQPLYFSKKLRLFSADTGALLATDCDIGCMVQQELVFSGSPVILEYVDSSCVELQDLIQYKVSR
ncbi:AN1-type zinc finger protein 1-like isoform X3 [Dreissena polymorpha]|uniref:AN1-type zinc finger protein 1-like isoform X3 n=1 Tax=Dreissena polymorpha TaxID=45954 RepID=UPI0022648DAC|nr:AN1-type zinc finger protein 1-like isoform X3 [Dreissena polymorpha]